MDIHNVIFPFYLISKLLGFSCFGLSYDSASLSWTRKWLHLITNCLLIMANVLLNMRQTMFAKYFTRDLFSTSTGRILSKSLLNFNGVMYTLSIFVSILVRNKVRLLVRKLHQFDVVYRQFFQPIDHHKHRRFVIYYLMTIFGLSILLVASSMTFLQFGWSSYNIGESHLNVIVFSITSAVNYSILLSHITLSLLVVHSRFKSINENFEISRKFTLDYNSKLIRNCRVMHDILNDSVELINSSFGFHAMWCTLACFGHNLMSLYSDYEIVVGNKNHVDIYISLAWNAFFTMQNVLVIAACSRVRAQAAETALVVHRLINETNEPELVQELRIFSQQLTHRRPVISCGLFDFDWRLYYSIIGACATYLVILIQFNSTYRSSINVADNEACNCTSQ